MADPGRERYRLSRVRRGRLKRAYLATTYRVHAPDGPIDLRIGRRSAPLDCLLERYGAQSWAFVSAANPGSRRMPAWHNLERHRALAEAVRSGEFRFLEGVGMPADARWHPEASLLVVGISIRAARAMARRFGQLAIVAGRRTEMPEIVWC